MKKKLAIAAMVSALIFISLGLFMYHSIRSPLLEGADEASDYLLNNNLLQTVDDLSFYHGGEGYWVAVGTDEDGETSIAWLNYDPEDRENTLVLPADSGVAKEEIKAEVSEELNVESFDSVRLGMEDGRPIYEFTYNSTQQARVFYYMSFETGEYVKSYSVSMNP